MFRALGVERAGLAAGSRGRLAVNEHYTIPEIATVGESEESCREKGIPYAVGRALYRDNSRGQITGDLSGLVKLVFSATDQKLLGVHILGEMASELVHVGQGCLHFGGTIDYFIQSVFNHPTLADQVTPRPRAGGWKSLRPLR